VKAKKVYEALGNLFVPKSEEEIRAGVEREFSDMEPESLLGSGIARQSIPMVKMAIEKGAQNWLKTYGTQNSSGNIWKIFNSGDNKDLAQQMIILGLKTPILTNEWKTNPYFRTSILEKTVYMGFVDVMEYILSSEKEKDITTFNAIYALDGASWSNWPNYPKTEKMLKDWVSKKMSKEKVSESVRNILKPRPEEEIKNVVKNMSYEEWKESVTDSITDFLWNRDLNSPLEGEEIEGKEEEYKNGVPPPTVAMQIIEDYFKKEWKPDGGMALTNTGGIELRYNDSGDGVEYRFTGETIPHSAEIKYDYQYQEDQEDAYFEDDHGNKWPLNDFMRV
jgi:hypothetical protein